MQWKKLGKNSRRTHMSEILAAHPTGPATVFRKSLFPCGTHLTFFISIDQQSCTVSQRLDNVLWEGGSSLIFLFLTIIQIWYFSCIVYFDRRTTCWFRWSQKFWCFVFPDITVSCQWEHFSWTHLQAARLDERCVGIWWPLKLPTAQFSSYNTGLCSSWPLLPSHAAHGDTLWTGWEDEGTSLHSANVFKLISNNMVMGAGISHPDPYRRLWYSRNSLLFCVCTWEPSLRSPILISCLYRRNQKSRGTPALSLELRSRGLWLRRAVKNTTEREKEKERGKRKWGLFQFGPNLFLFFN